MNVDEASASPPVDITRNIAGPQRGQTPPTNQWSPLNQEGMITYDRQFLLKLQFSKYSISRPQGLPNLPDIILDEPALRSSSNRNDISNTAPDFTPAFFQRMLARPAGLFSAERNVPDLIPDFFQTMSEREPVASVPIPKPVPVTPDNKDEKILHVEIKIEDVDMSKGNAKNNEMTTEALNSEPKKPKMQLQYNYKPDQWSPLNQGGKMIYDRDFLLQLQFSNNSVSKPQGLPNLPDIILDKPTLMSAAKRNDMGNTVPDFTPDFFQTMSGRPSTSQMIRKRYDQLRNDEPMKIIGLHEAENACPPGRKVETTKCDVTEARTQVNYQPREVYRKPREMERRPPLKPRNMDYRPPLIPRNMEDRPPLKPPSLPQLDQDGLKVKWESFEQEFDQYLEDYGLEATDDAIKCALLRQCIGKENMHIYDSFYFEKEDDRYILYELKKKFNNYCKRRMREHDVKKVDGNPSEDARQKPYSGESKDDDDDDNDDDDDDDDDNDHHHPMEICQKICQLHKAEYPWQPSRIFETAENEDLDETEARTQEIYRCVKSILNKLTPQKFKTLLKQVQDLNIDTETRLKGVTDLIFEQAVSEPMYTVVYAKMCRYLVQLKVPSDSEPGKKVSFRVIILTKCQREFEKDKYVEIDLEVRQKKIDEADSEDVKKQLQGEMEIAATTARRRSIGNIRLIGELFKLKMLTEHIMHHCVSKLIRSRDEENLECLCRLLTTIGRELDTEKVKPRIDQYFQKMQKIVGEKKTSSRVRFMLQDVIDLRLCNWVPRREDNNPKTIDQIHIEAAKENAQKTYLLSQNPPQSGGPSNRGGPQQNNQRNDDGWDTVASKPDCNIDMSNKKITETTVDGNIQLGPGGVLGRGSNVPANRFTGLRTEEEGGRPFGRGISPARSDSRNRGQGGGFGWGRLTPRSSMEGESDRAIANVRNLTGRTSNPASRESSRSREPRMDKPEAAPVPGILSEDEMKKKTKTIIDEYLHINDLKEALMCVSEISNPATVHLFIEFSINHVLERSSIARQQTGNLHHELVSKKIISVESYLKGLNQRLQKAANMEMDIPKIWLYLGELIGPMIQDGSVPLNFLKQACEPLQASGKSGVVVAAVLHDASRGLGPKKVASLWKSSGLQWTDFMAAENVTEFLADEELKFTVAADSQPSTPVDKVLFETIQEQLLVRLRDVNFDNEHMFDWIEANIPDESTKSTTFIRTLMTAVCRSAVSGGPNHKVNENVIKQRQSLLVKYLDSQQEFEIQALYALQAFVNELQHPGGVLITFFETLYDEDIISEDAFNQWSNSNDPAEQEGKGVAMKQVVQFFAWLKEGEQDES